MNKLERLLSEKHVPLLMAHFIAGYPNERESLRIAKALVEGGADILEVQIPFSDPMADGPTIAVACGKALGRGMTVAKSLTVIRAAAQLKVPMAVMSYLNPVFRFGITKFVHTIAKAGAHALIVPDCPLDSDEGRELVAAGEKYGICIIPVVSPGVPQRRLAEILKATRGFVYCTSRQGITGANSRFAHDLERYLAEVRKASGLPVGLGFGVRTAEDFKNAAKIADIVIAGSVFINAVDQARGSATTAVQRTARSLKGTARGDITT